MIVIGAGGLAKEVIEILISEKYKLNESSLFFFDDVTHDNNNYLFQKFKILHSVKEVREKFKAFSNQFVIGVGGACERHKMYKKFEALGGKAVSIYSQTSSVGSFGNSIKQGCLVMDYVTITNDVTVGEGTLINAHCLLGHGVSVGNFCSIAPGVKITGNAIIGDYVNIGTGAIILPKVKVGKNSFIGAGSVVSQDVPENSTVIGVLPSRVVGKRPEYGE